MEDDTLLGDELDEVEPDDDELELAISFTKTVDKASPKL
jgi:hypothetical protein